MGILSYAAKLKKQVADYFWPEAPKVEPVKPKQHYKMNDVSPRVCASIRVNKSKRHRAIRRHKRQQRIANA